jgi:di- and tripeptidase
MIYTGDSTVRIWSTLTLSPLYSIIPYLDTESGDIYSLTYSPTLSTIYFGCQNTSIQWLDLSSVSTPSINGAKHQIHSESGTSTPGTPGKRLHKFWDSVPQSQRSMTPQLASVPLVFHSSPDLGTTLISGFQELHVPSENVVLSHYGYVYSMALSPSHLYGGEERSHGEVYLFTGSGDEDVKVGLLAHKRAFLLTA